MPPHSRPPFRSTPLARPAAALRATPLARPAAAVRSTLHEAHASSHARPSGAFRTALAAALLAALLATFPANVGALSLDAEVEILAAEDARDASPALLGLLADHDAAARARAALAIGRIGRPDDVPPLAALLQDPDAEVRRTAAFALGEIDDSTAGFPLEELLLSGLERDADVRELAVYGLGKLGRGAEACRAALHDGAEAVQARALLSAWRISGATDAEEILQFSRHKKVEVRWCAAYCLMRLLGAPASGATPIPGSAPLTDEERDRIAARLLVLTEEDDARVVLQAARGLRIRPEEAVTERMRALLGHEDWRVRVEALRTLGAELPVPPTADADFDSTDAGDATDSTDARDATDANRGAAAGSVSAAPATPDRRDVPFDVLDPLLGDDNPNVVATLIEVLARIGGDEADEVLYAQLGSPVPRHRELAIASLAERLRERRDADGIVPAERLARFVAAVGPLGRDPVWSVAAATAEIGDVLPEADRGEFYLALARQEGRIAKVAVGPYLDWRDAREPGWPQLEQFQPELTEFLLAEDPMVVLMTLNGLGAVYQRAVDVDSASTDAAGDAATNRGGDTGNGSGGDDAGSGASAGSDGDAAGSDASAGWIPFANLLEEQRLRALDDPLAADVRQTIVDIAGAHFAVPEMEALVVRSADDPNFVVRRAAFAALDAAGKGAPRPAGPVETRHSRDELRAILEWAREDHRAIFDTATGSFEARLFTREAPLTCWNFAQLAESGFYDEGAWHRVVPDFVLQDGCPRGDGWGGPPYQIRCEINRKRYGRGALGMALSGKDTGGSQFFFTHAEQPHLDGGYTVFGELVSGRPAADLVSQGDPITRIRVIGD